MAHSACATIAVLVGLIALPYVSEAQQPIGFWLYVEGAWKSSFKQKAECDSAGAATGKSYECRPLGPPQTGIGQSPQGKWQTDVDFCRGVSGADAYTSAPGEGKVLGTAAQRFEFSRCMSERGNPVK